MVSQATKTLDDLRQVPIETAGRQELASEPSLEPGTRLGRYVVLYRVGGGGMGTVYAAYDPDLDRKVALKLLRRGPDPHQAAAETRREAQAMARLAHPNVVTVHDVGTLGDRAFIAMEYVDGASLREWLTAAERQWQEIVKVFLQAGQGLAAAHAAGLVHLDFKPGNVMLTRGGEARVLDFGLARLSAAGAEAARLDDGALTGTPAYLAPERLQGRPVDARSDQFSFCVALWEALDGRHPFAGAGPPEHPGPAAPGEPAARVPGWVRKVLARGLRADPEERYPTMAELLRALSPDSRQARNRWLAAACALLTLGGMALGYLQLMADRKPVCGDFQLRLRGVWDDERKGAVRQAFIETGLPFAEEAYRDVERALDEYTHDWAAMRTEACEATNVFGEQSDRMLDLRMLCLDGRLEEVRAFANELIGADRDVVARALAGAQKLSGLGGCADRVELTNLVLPPGDAESRRAFDEIRTAVEEQYARNRIGKSVDVAVLDRSAEESERRGFASLQARALELLAREQLYILGDSGAAEVTLHRALLAAIAAGDRPVQARLWALLAKDVGYFQARHEDARRWKGFAEAALAALGPDHEETEIGIYNDLSVVAWSRGELTEAEALARRAVETGERFWGPEDPRLASPLNNLANPLLDDERIEEAIAYFERAQALAEAAYGRWNPIHLGPSLTNLSTVYVEAGRYEDALAVTSRCLEIVEGFYGEHRNLTYPLINIGDILNHYFDRPEEAEGHLRRALPLARSGFGDTHPMTGFVLANLGDAMLYQLRLEEAETYLQRAAAVLEASSPRPDLERDNLFYLGRLAVAREEYGEALEPLERAWRLVVDEAPPLHDRIFASLLVALGEAHLGLGQPEQARPFLERAIEEGRADRFPGLRSQARFALARTLDPGERERATRLAEEALRMLNGDSPMTRRRRARLESWLRARSSPEDPR